MQLNSTRRRVELCRYKWVFKINERIKYKLSLTYTVLTTSQPSYLHSLISFQPHCSTRTSSVVTLSRPSTISSLKITDRSFRHASPRLWNQLPDYFVSLVSPVSIHLIQLSTHLCHHHHSHHSSLLHFFHSRLKTYLFNKSFPPQLYFFTHWTAFMIMGLYRTYHAHQLIFSFFFFYISCSFCVID